jgi:ankyrin repeat protein
MEAARCNQLECLKELIPISDLNERDEDGATALDLCEAPHSGPEGDACAAELLQVCDWSSVGPDGRTPLMLAAALKLDEWGGKPQEEWVRLMAEACGSETTNHVGETALDRAANFGREKAMRALLPLRQPEADPEGEQRRNVILLRTAFHGGNLACVQMALGLCDANARDDQGQSMLVCAVRMNKGADILGALVDAGADCAQTGETGGKEMTALEHAARSGSQAAFEFLLGRSGVGVVNPKTGETLLTQAAKSINGECVHLAIEVCELDARNGEGLTALMIAAAGLRADAIGELLAAGAEMDLLAPNGKTAQMEVEEQRDDWRGEEIMALFMHERARRERAALAGTAEAAASARASQAGEAREENGAKTPRGARRV